MSEQRLDQTKVAEALAMDRANLSRRLTGRVAERPSRAQVELLAEVLRMDPVSKIELLRLAGYAAGVHTQDSDDGQQALATAEPLGRTNGNASDTSSTPRQQARPRLRPQLPTLVALITLLTIVVGVAVLVGHTPDPFAAEPMAQIASPANGSTHALGWVELRGTARLPRPEAEHLWIVEQLAGYFWPQQQAVVDRDNWSAQARLGAGPDDVGKRLDLLLVLAPDTADHELRVWLEQGEATGDYRPMRGLPAGAGVLDHVAVTITSN